MNDDWDESSEQLKQLYLSLPEKARKGLAGTTAEVMVVMSKYDIAFDDLKTLREIAETLRE